MLRWLGIVDIAAGRQGLCECADGNSRFSFRFSAHAASRGERPGTTRSFAKETDHDHAWNHAPTTWGPRTISGRRLGGSLVAVGALAGAARPRPASGPTACQAAATPRPQKSKSRPGARRGGTGTNENECQPV